MNSSDFNKFVGRPLIHVADDVEALARLNGYSVNVMDPTFNRSNIMTDPKRVNVHIDDESVIRSIIIG